MTSPNPWIDGNDLRDEQQSVCGKLGYYVYQWRDTSVRVLINSATNEIVDVWEETE